MSDIRYLPVEAEGEVFFIGPVARWHWQNIEAMFDWLEARWIIADGNPEKLLDEPEVQCLMQRIINFCPRLDLPGVFGFPIERLEKAALVELFFGTEGRTAGLTKIQQYIPLPIQDWRLESEHEPIPTTDDPDMDIFASLSAAFTPTDALLLLKTLSPRQIDRLLWETAEIQRDPKDRAQESLSEDFAAWKQEHREDYRKSLGMEFKFPTPDQKEEPLDDVNSVNSSGSDQEIS
jgi:hypothetical protein